MTVYIKCKKINERKLAAHLDSERKQILRAWHNSKIKHQFGCRALLEKALRKNQQTIESADKAKLATLFTRDNYLFSTKEYGREETLYFRTGKLTGRLRQQHCKGPLAKIDKRARTHLFLSEERFKKLKKWRKEQKQQKRRDPPTFRSSQEKKVAGKRHIEFACRDDKMPVWHASGGKVRIVEDPKDRKRRVNRALKNILGIRLSS